MKEKSSHSYSESLLRPLDVLPDKFVGVAIYLDPTTYDGYHSGLVVCVDQQCKMIHYTGDEIRIDDLTDLQDIIFIKGVEFIDEQEILTFLSHCETIAENAQPTYGFVFDNAYYDTNGNYYSDLDIGERFTCVGFCINLISGFILDYSKYFELDDWDTDETDPKVANYIRKFQKENPNIIINHIKHYFKRITPNQYFTSAYIEKVPIRKLDIDDIIEDVSLALVNKHTEHS